MALLAATTAMIPAVGGFLAINMLRTESIA
jgi:hypothetical protein